MQILWDSTAKTSEVPTTPLCCSVSFLLSWVTISQTRFSRAVCFQIPQFFQGKKLLVSFQNWAFTLSIVWFWLCWVSTTRCFLTNSFYVSFHFRVGHLHLFLSSRREHRSYNECSHMTFSLCGKYRTCGTPFVENCIEEIAWKRDLYFYWL